MKYKLIGLFSVALTLIAIIFISKSMPEDNGKRYIEHIMAVEKTPCQTHTDNVLCTHLPIVNINTNGLEIPGKPIYDENYSVLGYTLASDGTTTIKATLDVVDNEKTYNHPDTNVQNMGEVMIRVRGHSSRRFEKPNYFIRFVNPDGTNNPQSFLGMDAHHEWALHGPFLDKSLIRNYMWYNISGEIMEYSPNVRFFELIINGEYRGVYLALETITSGKEGARLSLSVNKKDNTFSGYALRLDWGDTEEEKKLYPFTNYTTRAKTQHELVYPGTDNMTPELKEAIKDEFSLFEKTLYSYDYNNEKYGYKNYIDTDSFVDYFLINELTCNYDAGSLSTYIYKDIDGKYKMCVWDFNSACDFYQEQAMPTDEFRLNSGLWYQMLFMDSDFTDRVIKRYYELRKTVFSEEYLFGFIDDTIEYLGPAVERNYGRWGYTFSEEYDLLHPVERNPRTYNESISQLKSFLAKRLAFMDENIESISQQSAESKTKKYNEVSD
ncbi:MAG: CotH kinase family protein [Clostridia bacterium]|nr:CotH kinase family protein [Clostridia bacterium]MBQ8637375.1 CotH kinase family protein [Clostridia bacterium]